jgi:hypothetical protein
MYTNLIFPLLLLAGTIEVSGKKQAKEGGNSFYIY